MAKITTPAIRLKTIFIFILRKYLYIAGAKISIKE